MLFGLVNSHSISALIVLHNTAKVDAVTSIAHESFISLPRSTGIMGLEVLEELKPESLDNLHTEISATGKVVESSILVAKKLINLLPEIIFLILAVGAASNIRIEADGFSLSSLYVLFNEKPQDFHNLLFELGWISALYVLMSFFRSLLVRTLQRLSRKFENRFNALIDSAIDLSEELIKSLWWNLSRKPIHQYYNFVLSENENFEIPGSIGAQIPCSIQNTCVSLNVSLISSEGDNSVVNGFRKPIDLSDRTEIWDFLAAGRLDPKFRRIVITGKPGSGKSTLLKYLAVTYAQRQHKTVSKVSRKAPNLIPILLPVREISGKILQKQDVAKIIVNSLDELDLAKTDRFSKWITRCLKRGRCLVMIDGLDEVANELNLKRVNLWVNNLIRRYPDNFFVITSRQFGHDETILKNIIALEVRDLDLACAEDFIVKWYFNRERTAQTVARLGRYGRSKKWSSVWQQLLPWGDSVSADHAAALKNANRSAGELITNIRGNPSLAKMAVNPLSLSMMVIVHSSGNHLPESRAELYRVICDSLLSSRHNANFLSKRDSRNELSLNKEQKLAILQNLALNLMKVSSLEFASHEANELVSQPTLKAIGQTDADIDDVIEQMKNSGLLVDSGMGHRQFSHRCIQEYLAASQVRENQQENFLVNKINENWWNETIRIYAATSNQKSAAKIVGAAVRRFTRRPEENAVAFKLAYDCLEECPKLPFDLKENLSNLLDKNLESENESLRKYAAEVKLFQRFAKNFTPITIQLGIDQRYLSCSEYQLFIDSMLPLNKYYQPDDWYQFTFAESTSLEHITAIRPTDADEFCRWLSQLHTSQGLQFRLPTVEEETAAVLDYEAIEQDQHGCWCKDGTTYKVVGADAKLKANINQSLQSGIRTDLTMAAGTLKGKLQNARSRALQLTKALKTNSKKNLDKALESVLNINPSIDGYRGVSISVQPITFAIFGIQQVRDILSYTRAFRRDGDVKLSKRVRDKLVDLKDYLRANKAFYEKTQIQRLELLVEDMLSNRGYERYRDREIQVIYQLIEGFASIFISYIDRACADIELQVEALESALVQVKQYDASHNLEIAAQVFNEFLPVIKKLTDEANDFAKALEASEGLSFLEDAGFFLRYVEIFKDFWRRSTPGSVDLVSVLPFFTMAFSFWTVLAKVAMLNDQKREQKAIPEFLNYPLAEYEARKLRAVNAYIVVLHMSLTLQREIPLLGGIRLVREKLNPESVAATTS